MANKPPSRVNGSHFFEVFEGGFWCAHQSETGGTQCALQCYDCRIEEARIIDETEEKKDES